MFAAGAAGLWAMHLDRAGTQPEADPHRIRTLIDLLVTASGFTQLRMRSLRLD